ncbi:MAG TPA: hypothetical protein VER03_04600 [Bryobacteraceae bacterium]|nr:hypothetical protein [Bryobacteraceae bacterium]
MNQRRNFLRLASAAAVPAAAAAVLSSGVARADNGSVKDILGAWDTIHTLPFPPFQFREFLTFAEGGVVQETNSFLHSTSKLDFSAFGLPAQLSAANGMGSWTRISKNAVTVVFRKMVFDGAGQYIGDFRAEGTITTDGETLWAQWPVLKVIKVDGQEVPLPPATSTGTRLK